MTPAAWSFFTADSLALLAILGQQLKANSDRKSDKAELLVSADFTEMANTVETIAGDVSVIKSDIKAVTSRVNDLEEML